MDTKTQHRAEEYERLTNKSVQTKFRKLRKRGIRSTKAKASKTYNELIYKSEFINVRNNPTLVKSMELLRNTILPVAEDFDRVLRWLNAVTIK